MCANVRKCTGKSACGVNETNCVKHFGCSDRVGKHFLSVSVKTAITAAFYSH